MLKLLKQSINVYLTKVSIDTSDNKFCEIFKSLLQTVDGIRPIIKEIQGFAGDYDLDEKTPANGYRSFVYIVEKAAEKTLILVENVEKKSENIFFRRKFYEK